MTIPVHDQNRFIFHKIFANASSPLPMKNGAKLKTFPSSVRQSWKSLEDDDEGGESDVADDSMIDSSFSDTSGIDTELLIDGNEHVSPVFMFAFMFISFGYMLPWTALGSLISYYKYTYNAHFYVKIYCAYYLPGLPVSVLQYLFDERIDRVYGSQNMFLARGIIGYAALAIILFSLLWVDDESTLVGLFALLGLVGWWLHGTASMLASMFPKVLIAYLQIGFRCPEIYAVIMDYFLSLDKDASEENLNIFYKATTVAALLSLSFWILVIGSSSATKYFEEKDERIRSSDDVSSSSNKHESRPFISQRLSSDINQQYTAIDAAADWQTVRSSSLDDEDEIGGLLGDNSVSSGIFQTTLNTLFRYCCIIPANCTGNLLRRGFAVLYSDDAVFDAVCPLCLALLVTMWSSIFQASFFAYVESPKGRDIEQILYFTRLFSDLFGRPLTFLARPSFIKGPTKLLQVSMIRCFLLVIFFIYTFMPNFPQSDWFIIIYVALYSISSGYISVLCYEYAASSAMSRAQRAHAANILNMSFQMAAFIAVVMSVLITSSSWITDDDTA